MASASAADDAGPLNIGAAAPDRSAQADLPALYTSNRLLLTIGVMAATIMQILDTTIANVALPHMQPAAERDGGYDHLGTDELYRRVCYRNSANGLAV